MAQQQTTLRLSQPAAGDSQHDPVWRPQRGDTLRIGGGSYSSEAHPADRAAESPQPAAQAVWRSSRPSDPADSLANGRRRAVADDSGGVAAASYGQPGAGRWRPPSRSGSRIQPKSPAGTPAARLEDQPQPAASAPRAVPRRAASTSSNGRQPLRLETSPAAEPPPLTSASIREMPTWDESPSPAASPASSNTELQQSPPPLEAPVFSIAQAPQDLEAVVSEDLPPPPPKNLRQDLSTAAQEPDFAPLQPDSRPPGAGDPALPLPARERESQQELLDRARVEQEREKQRRKMMMLGERLPQNNNQDCATNDALLELLHNRKLSDIRIDVTPAFKPWLPTEQREESFARNMKAAESRTWRNLSGEIVAQGRLVDFRWGKVYVEGAEGQVVEAQFDQLGSDEQCFVSGWWEVPTNYRLAGQPYQYRDFTPSTFTWQASAACYNPLYFEQPGLERYGHTVGLMQPVLSGAHFFTSIATLPYKMGIHPPQECRYPLGYYRVGECAPRLLPPIPISLRGALLQAGVVTGASAIFP